MFKVVGPAITHRVVELFYTQGLEAGKPCAKFRTSVCMYNSESAFSMGCISMMRLIRAMTPTVEGTSRLCLFALTK